MTIPLTGSGGLFTRFGHLIGAIVDVNGLRGGTPTARVLSGANMPNRVLGTIVADFNNGTGIPQVLGDIGSVLTSFQGALDGFPNAIERDAMLMLQAMYGIDVLGLSSKAGVAVFQSVGIGAAVQGLINQMTVSGDSVQAATVALGAQTAVGTPTGNPVVVTSLVNGRGQALQLPFPETLTITCMTDRQSSGVAGNEALRVTGQTSVSDTLSFRYPAGSGVSATMQAVDGSKSSSTGNLLQNSDFLTATTANYPDNWVSGPGVIGTTIFQGTGGSAYTTGGGFLQFTGDAGGTLSALKQPFKTAISTLAGMGGTRLALTQNLVYHWNGWYKVSSVPTAGVLEIALVDGSGAILTNDAGTQLKTLVDLHASGTTSYQAINGAFQLPAVLPAAYSLRLRLSTAIDNGVSVYLGRFSVAQASGTTGNGLYAGGPYLTIHSGNSNLVNGLNPDTWTLAVSNNYSTSGSGLLHQWFDRIFNLRSLANPSLQLPSSNTPTVADTLIA